MYIRRCLHALFYIPLRVAHASSRPRPSIDELGLRHSIVFGALLHRVLRALLLRRFERVQGANEKHGNKYKKW